MRIITGLCARHTNTGDESPVPVPCVVYQAVCVNGGFLLFLVGRRTRIPLRVLGSKCEPSTRALFVRSWFPCIKIRGDASDRQGDCAFFPVFSDHERVRLVVGMLEEELGAFVHLNVIHPLLHRAQ